MGNENNGTSHLVVLDKHLLSFGKEDVSWTVRNAVEGVQIFGGVGSGKTSGSGCTIALKYLAADFGGLVLTVKPDEREMWEKYCRKTKRIDDLVVIEPNGDDAFDFLEYEGNLGGTDGIVEVLKTVIRASQGGGSQSSNEQFWDDALEILLCHVIDLCRIAYGSVSVRHMYDIMQSLPSLERPKDMPGRKKTAYRKAIEQAWERCTSNSDQRAMELLEQFFEDTYRTLSDRTRSVVDFSFAAFLFRLTREPIASLFCSGKTTVTPEDCLTGKVILLNVPVKLYTKVGKDVQVLFKYMWQRAMERRKVDNDAIPVFLWSDEAQNFLHEHDAVYQATARSSLIATVYITQNLSNYIASMGGNEAVHRVYGFLGTLSTKVFHANADTATNDYASALIGDRLREQKTETQTVAGQWSAGTNTTQVFEPKVRPFEFTLLKTGSHRNNYITRAYVQFQGNVLRSENHLLVSFLQPDLENER